MNKLFGVIDVISPFSYEAAIVYLRCHLYTFYSSVQYFLRHVQAQSLEITLQSTNPDIILGDSGEESQRRGHSPNLQAYYTTLDETKMTVIIKIIVICPLHNGATKSTHM